MDDFVYWKLTRDGGFSTKSAYSLLVRQSVVSIVSTPAPDQWWKSFWGLPLLPRFKLFCWKLLHDALPLLATLFSKGLPVDPVCTFCCLDLETTSHLFRDCPFIRILWNSTLLSLNGTLPESTSFTEWVVSVVSYFRRSKDLVSLTSFVSLLWAIWIVRNGCVFRQAIWSPSLFHHLSQDWTDRVVQAQEFHRHLTSLARSSPNPCQELVPLCLQGKLSDPLDHCLVFYGAWLSHDNCTGTGWIVRGVTSDTILGGGARVCRVSNALQAELQACLWGLRLALRRGFLSLLIYKDCAPLVSLFRLSGTFDISCLWLLREIQELLPQFSVCHLCKVPRNWVAPAHWLAVGARDRRFLCWSF
ncbi:uncharacterized protein LOC110700742 [Chenopodium quinoa]|uniref:uncharacterized protein LOC110700742 n=1 Tax=Chenopodium quinoa TaxID=63459 RepID=UPI000B76CA3F|nr:uncharacterized protein LOC110700742 [Chenopodium quinoa]